jgi:cytochrome c2
MRAAPLAAGVAAAAAAFVAVALATDDDAPRGGTATRPAAATATRTPDAGRLVFARMGCGGCHTFAPAGSEGIIGPQLTDIAVIYDARRLRDVILHPPSGIMPDDFGQRMTSAELDDLVAYLRSGSER